LFFEGDKNQSIHEPGGTKLCKTTDRGSGRKECMMGNHIRTETLVYGHEGD